MKNLSGCSGLKQPFLRVMDERVARIVGFDTIKERLASCAMTANGKSMALALMPARTQKRAEKLLAETKEAEILLLAASAHPLMGFDDVSVEISRLRSGAALSCGELLRIMRLFRAAKRAQHSIGYDEERNLSILPDACEGLFYDDALIAAIDHAVMGEEQLADDASAELRSIRRRIRSENESIREKLQNIIRSNAQSKFLQDDIITMRNGRFVVPVKQEHRSQVKGLVHGQSASGATVFVEPMGVVESNNKLKLLEEEEKREIERILQFLSNQARPYVQQMVWNLEILTYLDVVFAKAALAVRMRAYPPALSERELRILRGRHPLIEEKTVVPVTLQMEQGCRALIITGPNTGGKTVTLKLIGLFAMMAQSGLFLPADEGTTLPVFREIFADIGDEQSIEQSLSTFSSHMKNIIEITEQASAASLVLIDELGAGTDPEEGAALAMAILKELALRGLMLFATTHYSEIKAFALTTPGFMNASMEFDVETLSPTFRLVAGVAGASNALLISERLGLSSSIICSAKQMMREERLRFDDMMLEAERTKTLAQKELAEAEEAKRKAEETIRTAAELEEEVNVKRATLIERAQEEAYDIVKEARDEAERVIKELKKLETLPQPERTKAVASARRTLAEKRDALEQRMKKGKKPAKHVDPGKLRLGDAVRVISLDVTGTVDKLPDAKGMVRVRAGIMKLNIPYTDLAPAPLPKGEVKRTANVRVEPRTVGLSINLTGYTVDEALMELDKYLDDAFLSGRMEVSVIHGKGTGALRSGIHQYLKRHPHVKSFRLGRFGEGEDGVTIVTLK